MAQSGIIPCDRSVVSPDTPVSSTNKTDGHDITEILLKVALNTVNQTKPTYFKINLMVTCAEFLITVQYKYIKTLWNMHAQRCQFSGLSTNIICKLVNSGHDHNVILKGLWKESSYLESPIIYGLLITIWYLQSPLIYDLLISIWYLQNPLIYAFWLPN